MVRTVSLDEDKHSVMMLRNVKQMKHEDDFCDFTIKVKNNEFHAHRVIIAAGSPYFKAMLKHDTKESQEGRVEMKNVDAECVKNCIDFMYSGKFDIPDGKIDELLHVAIMMQLDNIKEAICKILDEELNCDNFYETRNVGEMYQLEEISTKCEAYYKDNFIAISAQPEFQNEVKSHLVKILKSKKFSEDDKLAVSIRWVGNDPEKRVSLIDLLKNINLKKVTPSYLNDLLQNHPIISNDLRLYKFLSQPLVGYFEKNGNGQKSQGNVMFILFDKDADCLRSYNLSTNEVAKFHDENFKRLGPFTAVSMESYIYVLCGNKSVHRLNVEDKSSKWEKLPVMISHHGSWPPSVAQSGLLYAVASSSSPTVDFEKFDLKENKWLRLQSKPTPVDSPTLVSLNDSIYCIGGWDGSKEIKTFCKFTPSTSKWVDLQPMNRARRLCGAVAVEQKIFVMGGWCGKKAIEGVECYDVVSGQWTCLSPMIESHSQNLAHHTNGWIFCVSRFESTDKIEKYDIRNDKWSKVEFKGQSNFNIYDCCTINCE